MMTTDTRRNTFRSIFGIPLLVGLISIIGLISALLADHWADLLSWLALGVPLLLCAWYAIAKPA